MTIAIKILFNFFISQSLSVQASWKTYIMYCEYYRFMREVYLFKMGKLGFGLNHKKPNHSCYVAIFQK